MSNRDNATPDGTKTVLARREEPGVNGHMFFRFDPQNQYGEFGVVAGGAWWNRYPSFVGAMDTLMVSVFQIQQVGNDIRMRRVTGPSTVENVLLVANKTLVPNVPVAAPVPLSLGGWRNRPRTDTTGTECGKDLVVHELRTYNRLLVDAELLTVYNDLLTRWKDDDLVVQWDAAVYSSLRTAAGQTVTGPNVAVQTWKPTVGGTLTTGRDLVASGTGASTILYNNQPGVFIGGNGNILEGAADIPLLGRSVALVFRMSNRDQATPDSTKTVLARREEPGVNGDFLLRFDPNNNNAEMGVYAGGWWLKNPVFAGAMDTLTVLVYQMEQSGSDIRTRRVTGPSTLENVVHVSGRTFVPNTPASAPVPLSLGGWRNKPRTATTGNECGKDLVVHELRVYSRLLADAELLSLYNELLNRWKDDDLLVQWDAGVYATLLNASNVPVTGAGQAVQTWKPSFGGSLSSARNLVAIRTGALSVTYNSNKLGLFVGSNGNILEGAVDVPLLGRAVALVFRMVNRDGATPDQTKTVLAQREEPGVNGDFFLRFNPNDQSGEFGAVAGAAWQSIYPAFQGFMNTTTVCVFQVQQSGADIRVRRVSGTTIVTNTLLVAGRTLVSNAPGVPLTLGGWRNKPRTATVATECGKDLIVHELRVYTRLLTDTEMLNLYGTLVTRWTG